MEFEENNNLGIGKEAMKEKFMEMDFISVSERAQKLYRDLIIQRDTVQSKTLAALLEKEIAACIRMMDAFAEYAELHQEKMAQASDRRSNILQEAQETAKSFSDPNVSVKHLLHAQNVYEKMAALGKRDELTYDRSVDIYLTVLTRDFKDWDAFAVRVGEAIVDGAINFIPVVSTVQFICNTVSTISELYKAYQDNGTDYAEVDKQLLIIEAHTQMADKATEMFLQYIDILNQE